VLIPGFACRTAVGRSLVDYFANFPGPIDFAVVIVLAALFLILPASFDPIGRCYWSPTGFAGSAAVVAVAASVVPISL